MTRPGQCWLHWPTRGWIFSIPHVSIVFCKSGSAKRRARGPATKPIRLAVLGSSTIDHILPAVRVGALRRGLWVSCYAAGYGQYHQELLNAASALTQFKPDTVLFSLDARHVLGLASEPDAIVEKMQALWNLARQRFGCNVIQQTLMPVFEPLMGNNDYRLPSSPHHKISMVNRKLREVAEKDAVDLFWRLMNA